MVAEALADVRARGDAALVDSIRRFDCPEFAGSDAIVDPARIAEAQAALDPILRAAIDVAVSNVRAVAEAQVAVWDGNYYAVELMASYGYDDGAVRAGIARYITDDDVDRLLDAVDAL